jgi:hypothetical protein
MFDRIFRFSTKADKRGFYVLESKMLPRERQGRTMYHFIVFVIATLACSSWAEAETIDVKHYGTLDLAPFACTDVSRSSFINRTCYDKAKQFMVVQLRGTYYPYCEMQVATYEAFLAAPSMGKYYNANIKGSGTDGPFDCRTHALPKY